MITGLVVVAVLVFLAFKMGQASEVMRERDRMLDTAGVQPTSRASEGREHGNLGPPAVSSVYDREEDATGEGLYLLPRRDAEEAT